MNIRNFGTGILVWQETERLNACKLNKSSVVLMCNLISTSHTPSFDSFEGWVPNSVLLRVQTELRRYYRVPIQIKPFDTKFRYLRTHLGMHRREREHLGAHTREREGESIWAHIRERVRERERERERAFGRAYERE